VTQLPGQGSLPLASPALGHRHFKTLSFSFVGLAGKWYVQACPEQYQLLVQILYLFVAFFDLPGEASMSQRNGVQIGVNHVGGEVALVICNRGDHIDGRYKHVSLERLELDRGLVDCLKNESITFILKVISVRENTTEGQLTFDLFVGAFDDHGPVPHVHDDERLRNAQLVVVLRPSEARSRQRDFVVALTLLLLHPETDSVWFFKSFQSR
jgi:hypothetical protein